MEPPREAASERLILPRAAEANEVRQGGWLAAAAAERRTRSWKNGGGQVPLASVRRSFRDLAPCQFLPFAEIDVWVNKDGTQPLSVIDCNMRTGRCQESGN